MGRWWGARRVSELGGGESATRVLVFEKAREAWKSQSHISAHFAPIEYTYVLVLQATRPLARAAYDDVPKSGSRVGRE